MVLKSKITLNQHMQHLEDEDYVTIESDNGFIQARKNPNGGYIIEYQDSSQKDDRYHNQDKHYQARENSFSLQDIKEILQHYISNSIDGSWKNDIEWRLFNDSDWKKIEDKNKAALKNSFLEALNQENIKVANKRYYENIFQEKELESFRAEGAFLTKWNWAASSFGPFWLAYRRMCKGFFGVASFYLAAFSYALKNGFFWLGCFHLIVCLILGLFGTGIYAQWLRRKYLRQKELKQKQRNGRKT